MYMSRMHSGDSSVPHQLPTTGSTTWRTTGTRKTTGKVMTGTGKVTGTGSLLLSTESNKPP